MYTRPFRLSGVTVVPFNDIFPARNSTKYLVEDPREPGTRLGNRAPEVVILKKQSEARRAASRAQCPTHTLASPRLPGRGSAPGCARPAGVRRTEHSPAEPPLPRRHRPPVRSLAAAGPGGRPGLIGPALLPRPVLLPLVPAWSRVPLCRRCRHQAPTWPCSHSA